jgi:hypothetical protein
VPLSTICFPSLTNAFNTFLGGKRVMERSLEATNRRNYDTHEVAKRKTPAD